VLDVFVAGLGRAGRGILRSLTDADVPVAGTWRGRTQTPLPTLPDRPHILLLAVPDPAVGPLAAALQRGEALPPDTVVLHLAARLRGDAARPDASCSAHFGGFHPLQAFPAEGPPVPGFAVGIGGEEAACRVAWDLAEAMGSSPFSLPDEARAGYHAAAVLASNLVVGLQALAQGTLRASLGVSERSAAEMLEPLLAGTLANLVGHAPVDALTGPLVRADLGALQAHLGALEGSARQTYAALSLALLERVAERWPPSELARARRALQNALHLGG
jgi:predicted short-subunit dehydrogenase-like oxidoreductase (DUF2520 family)